MDDQLNRSALPAANMINTFKNRLDKFWEHQGVLYNYRANITGTGNRSIVVD